MSFPKRIKSNLRRSLSNTTSSKADDSDRRVQHQHQKQQRCITNDNESFANNQQQQRPTTAVTTTATLLYSHQLKQQSYFRGEMNTYAALSAQAINKNLSDTDDVERERMRDDRKFIADGFIVNHMKQSPAQTRLRERRRKRSNTIDVGALLEFRSTVSHINEEIRSHYTVDYRNSKIFSVPLDNVSSVSTLYNSNSP